MWTSRLSSEGFLGSLDTTLDSLVKANIYVSSKANWVQLETNLISCDEAWDETSAECCSIAADSNDTNNVRPRDDL